MKEFSARDLNQCHQVRSQTPIPLSYIIISLLSQIDINRLIIDERYIPVIIHEERSVQGQINHTI